jgi:hypothetical protein
LARRAGIRHTWFAFVPLLNSYLLGELAGTCSFASMKIKQIGLWYALSEGVTCVAYILSDLAMGTLYYNGAAYDSNIGWVNIADGLGWAQTMDMVMSYVLLVLQLVYIFFFVLAVMSFFRKYAAKNAGIFSVSSIFVPIVYSILVFVVRNNTPIDYEQYIRDVREKREAYYRQNMAYRNYQPPYSDPYSNRTHTQNRKDDDVFTEFSSDPSSNSSSDNDNDEFFK